MSVTKRRKVVVIGGGITGLTAAYYLQQAADPVTDVIVIESSLRVGGKIQTIRKDGFVLERGPESFIDKDASVKQLALDLGIEDQVIHHTKGLSYVAVGKDLYKIPGNILLGKSPNVASLMTTRLFSLSGKIRAAGDFFAPQRTHEDEPIGDFFRRHFGKEVVENLIEPLMAGTFAGDIDHISIRSMFPYFYQLEQQYGSLLMGLRKQKSLGFVNQLQQGELGYSTFEGGLETLVEAFEQKLKPHSIMKGVKVEQIERLPDDKLKISLNSMSPIQADAVIVTTPFNATKAMFKQFDAMQQIPKMNYSSIATVTMAFKSEHLPKYKEAMNFFVSRNSELAITSCTWSNRKWPNTAPAGYDLLRVYIGRVGDEAIVELSDSEIEKIVLADLQTVVGLQHKPLFTVVTRWKQAMPQYNVGHAERLAQLKEEMHEVYPNVYLAGSSYEGISMPECVAQGQAVATQLNRALY